MGLSQHFSSEPPYVSAHVLHVYAWLSMQRMAIEIEVEALALL